MCVGKAVRYLIGSQVKLCSVTLNVKANCGLEVIEIGIKQNVLAEPMIAKFLPVTA